MQLTTLLYNSPWEIWHQRKKALKSGTNLQYFGRVSVVSAAAEGLCLVPGLHARIPNLPTNQYRAARGISRITRPMQPSSVYACNETRRPPPSVPFCLVSHLKSNARACVCEMMAEERRLKVLRWASLSIGSAARKNFFPFWSSFFLILIWFLGRVGKSGVYLYRYWNIKRLQGCAHIGMRATWISDDS